MSSAIDVTSGKIQEVLAELADAKLRATRTGLAVAYLEGIGSPTRSGAEFDRLVSDLYKFWREQCAADIRYVLESSASSSVKRGVAFSFTTTVRQLRTAAQHAENDGAVEWRAKWFERACSEREPTSATTWEACGTQLHNEILAALQIVRDSAQWLVSDAARAQEWRSQVEASALVDPLAVREQVLADLELSIAPQSAQHLDRGIQYQFGRRATSSGDDVAQVLESIVEREILAQTLKRLPCSYVTILDRLNSWGHAAVSSLLVAHAVAEMETWSDEEGFLLGVERVWAAATAK